MKVDLPEANSDPVENQDPEPLIVSIRHNGELFLNLGVDQEQVLSLATVKQRVSVVMRRNPKKPVMVWGDRNVPYGEVVLLMTALQEAGAPSVGLVTEPARCTSSHGGSASEPRRRPSRR